MNDQPKDAARKPRANQKHDSKLLRNSRRNDPRLYDDSNSMKSAITLLFDIYCRYRKRKGRRNVNISDRQSYIDHLNNIVTDLHASWLGDQERYVGYSRGKASFQKGGSYWDAKNEKPILSPTFFLNLIDTLSELDFIENHIAKSGHNSISSRMRCKPKLSNLLKANRINWASIKTDYITNAIVVKDEHKKIVPLPDPGNFDLQKAEANLQRINGNLEWSLINLAITDEEYEALRRRMRPTADGGEEAHELETQRELLEFSNRSLRRIFVYDSFEYGGRFYGGWWQGLPKEYRKYIKLEGCITVEMDYSTIQPRILYAKTKTDPRADSYIVPGWGPEYREVAKKAFNQLVNSSDASRNPNQWHRFAPNIEPDPLPKNWGRMDRYRRAAFQREEFRKRTGRDYSDFLGALKDFHHPIDDFFFSQAWKWLQRTDSDIAEAVMLKLLDDGYTALPLHDSFIVRRSAEGRLREYMNDAFREVVGVEAKVDRNTTVYDGESRGLIRAHEIWDEVLEDLEARKGYHQRDGEWKSVWGLWGYE